MLYLNYAINYSAPLKHLVEVLSACDLNKRRFIVKFVPQGQRFLHVREGVVLENAIEVVLLFARLLILGLFRREIVVEESSIEEGQLGCNLLETGFLRAVVHVGGKSKEEQRQLLRVWRNVVDDLREGFKGGIIFVDGYREVVIQHRCFVEQFIEVE